MWLSRRDARAAAQHELPAHELAVVFADRAFRRLEARIGRKRRCASTPTRRRRSDASPAVRLAQARAAGVLSSTKFPRSGSPSAACSHSNSVGRRRAGPGRERVSLEVAHMRDRRRGINRLRAAQRHRPIAALALFPIKRRRPAFRLHRRPSRREPEQRRPIAAVGHELHPFRVGDEPVREFDKARQARDAAAPRNRRRSPRRRVRSPRRRHRTSDRQGATLSVSPTAIGPGSL